jgi:XTP/dITP diphosphohydrolase
MGGIAVGKEVVFGSWNKGKVREFEALLGEEGLRLLSWKDFANPFSVEEDGTTFRENALKKASFTAKITHTVSLADDSGLEVEYLQGRPGIFSARYAGPAAPDAENIAKVLEELQGVPFSLRKARFVCVIAICTPGGRCEWVEGECGGVIADSPRGTQGFGYDPIFLAPELGKTFAELNPGEKNRISHRAQAVNKLRPLLKKYLLGPEP